LSYSFKGLIIIYIIILNLTKNKSIYNNSIYILYLVTTYFFNLISILLTNNLYIYTSINYYLDIFFSELLYCIENLHITIFSSIIFRLILLILITIFCLLGLCTYYIGLFLCVFISINFIWSKNKVRFVINLFFIMSFWSICAQVCIPFLSLYNGNLLSPIDWYSNEDPINYKSQLEHLHNKLKYKFARTNGLGLYESRSLIETNELDLFSNTIKYDFDSSATNEYIISPHKYGYQDAQSFAKLNPSIKDLGFLPEIIIDKEGESISKEDIHKMIHNHNSKVKFIYKDTEVSKECIKNLYLDKIFGNLIWGISSEGKSGPEGSVDQIIEWADRSKKNNIYSLMNFLEARYLSSLLDYSQFKTAQMWYEEGKYISNQSKIIYDTIQKRYVSNEGILDKLPLLKNSESYLDTDLDNLNYIKNYLDDNNTYQEICDNVLCTGIQIFFWSYILDNLNLELDNNPNISYNELCFLLREYTKQSLNVEGVKEFVDLYIDINVKYIIDTYTKFDIQMDQEFKSKFLNKK
jgi:hypothetical protein